MPKCRGQIVDGYCNTCGAPAGAKEDPPTPSVAMSTRLGSVSLGSARVGAGNNRPRPAAPRGPSGHLGAGYTTVPVEPTVDPASAILKDPEVPEDRRMCPHCGAEVGRSTKDTPGRLEGYCPACRKPYSFTPKLSAGDIVAGQYEVAGCLTHGGQGWIYMARDRNVSNRWVVLKGLLNLGDESAMQAVLTEQRFLAELQHPLIVEIYNFVMHSTGAYIVMEFVGGRSLKQILKARMAEAKGVYNPFPVDQALAYILEILPAFSYLHGRGLLYCDFKPDNLMHVGDTVKMIDMGGVRPIDDDDSMIFGTVGFQAPEVPTQGCTIASDIYTIGRTLMVLCAEVKGYQSTYATQLPPISQVPIFTRYDSVYRLIAKACAPDPSDRFSTVTELRRQVVGVLREVVSSSKGAAATDSAPSEYFDAPTVVSDAFTWKQLPRLKPDPTDPGLTVLGGLSHDLNSRARFDILLASPVQTEEIRLAQCLAAIEIGATQSLTKIINQILKDDPWEWRAAWVEGLAALNSGDWKQAQSCFNAVYGQIPGELAPKFALAVACEMGGELEVAEALYQTCATTDSAYVTGSAFGLARIRAKHKDSRGTIKDTDAVLSALALVPTTSGGWSQSRRLAATYLTYSGKGVADLSQAWDALDTSGASTEERLRMELEIYKRALTILPAQPRPDAFVEKIGEIRASRVEIRAKVEALLRQQAAIQTDPVKRISLIDQANSLRKWTFI